MSFARHLQPMLTNGFLFFAAMAVQVHIDGKDYKVRGKPLVIQVNSVGIPSDCEGIYRFTLPVELEIRRPTASAPDGIRAPAPDVPRELPPAEGPRLEPEGAAVKAKAAVHPGGGSPQEAAPPCDPPGQPQGAPPPAGPQDADPDDDGSDDVELIESTPKAKAAVPPQPKTYPHWWSHNGQLWHDGRTPEEKKLHPNLKDAVAASMAVVNQGLSSSSGTTPFLPHESQPSVPVSQQPLVDDDDHADDGREPNPKRPRWRSGMLEEAAGMPRDSLLTPTAASQPPAVPVADFGALSRLMSAYESQVRDDDSQGMLDTLVESQLPG